MAPDPTSLDPLDPGSMTVPPLFGWEHIVAVLALMAVVGVAFLLHSIVRGSAHGRSDWQSWLDARSSRPVLPGRPDQAGPDQAGTPAGIHPSRLAEPSPEVAPVMSRAHTVGTH
jgi:hypothetical protein